MLRTAALVAAGVFAVAGLAFVSAEDAEAKRAKCVMMTGKGSGIGDALARNFAADSLADGQAQRKMKGQGKVAYKCSQSTGLSNCTASQRSCAVPAKK